MKNLILLLFVLFTGSSFCQHQLLSGEYEDSLLLAYNPTTHKVTGYYENATGEDTKFSCIFYIEGTVSGKQCNIQTYFPNDKGEDLIEGTMKIVDSKSIKIKLPEEHGGCWNVQHFADEPVNFEVRKPTNWIQINYIIKERAYFFKEKKELKKMKSYLVKNDIVCVEKIEKEWAYCSYYGNKITKGWLKVADLNKI